MNNFVTPPEIRKKTNVRAWRMLERSYFRFAKTHHIQKNRDPITTFEAYMLKNPKLEAGANSENHENRGSWVRSPE